MAKPRVARRREAGRVDQHQVERLAVAPAPRPRYARGRRPPRCDGAAASTPFSADVVARPRQHAFRQVDAGDVRGAAGGRRHRQRAGVGEQVQHAPARGDRRDARPLEPHVGEEADVDAGREVHLEAPRPFARRPARSGGASPSCATTTGPAAARAAAAVLHDDAGGDHARSTSPCASSRGRGHERVAVSADDDGPGAVDVGEQPGRAVAGAVAADGRPVGPGEPVRPPAAPWPRRAGRRAQPSPSDVHARPPASSPASTRRCGRRRPGRSRRPAATPAGRHVAVADRGTAPAQRERHVARAHQALEHAIGHANAGASRRGLRGPMGVEPRGDGLQVRGPRRGDARRAASPAGCGTSRALACRARRVHTWSSGNGRIARGRRQRQPESACRSARRCTRI